MIKAEELKHKNINAIDFATNTITDQLQLQWFNKMRVSAEVESKFRRGNK